MGFEHPSEQLPGVFLQLELVEGVNHIEGGEPVTALQPVLKLARGGYGLMGLVYILIEGSEVKICSDLLSFPWLPLESLTLLIVYCA